MKRFPKIYRRFAVMIMCFSFFGVNAQDLYKTPSGKKYHLSSCRMVENVSKKITFEDISTYNLEACKICKPILKTSNTSSFSAHNKAVGTSETVQCKGKTQKGLRCKHKTSLANGYCYQHTSQNSDISTSSFSTQTNSSVCGAKTKSGGSCKRKVKNGGRCYQH